MFSSLLVECCGRLSPRTRDSRVHRSAVSPVRDRSHQRTAAAVGIWRSTGPLSRGIPRPKLSDHSPLPRREAWQLHVWSDVCLSPAWVRDRSHIWIDFRGIPNAFMREHAIDYLENSRRARTSIDGRRFEHGEIQLTYRS